MQEKVRSSKRFFDSLSLRVQQVLYAAVTYLLLLSICLGGACFGLGWLFSPLYAVHFDPQEFLDRSLIQALYLPVAWLLLTATRPLACSHDEE